MCGFVKAIGYEHTVYSCSSENEGNRRPEEVEAGLHAL
jgi:hypothetical protein